MTLTGSRSRRPETTRKVGIMDQSRSSSPQVENNTADRRFEVRLDGQLAVTEYERSDTTITFTHTEVPEGLRGRGLAGELAQTALEYARDEQLEVVPQCPFVAGYIRSHPEYQPLVAAGYQDKL